MLATLHAETVVELRAYVLLTASRSRWRHAPDARDRLRENAQTPLDRTTPAEAVSLALRTFSYLHTLCTRVANVKLKELYALEDFHSLTGIPYEVPSPSPLHWIAEQRAIASLFVIRSYVLLGLDAPPIPLTERGAAKCSVVRECYHFFGAYMDDITGERTPEDICWHANATIAPQTGDGLWQTESDVGGTTDGWVIFRLQCCRQRVCPLFR